MRKLGHIDAQWAPSAREDVERALQKANVKGGVLVLFKTDDDPDARWSYAVYTPDRIEALGAAMEARGFSLVYDLDGLRVAISNMRHVKELDGKMLERSTPGYLSARPR